MLDGVDDYALYCQPSQRSKDLRWQRRNTTGSEQPRASPPHDADDAEFLAAMGRRVREARERRGMARKVLSQNAGVSERYLAQLEGGDGNASVLLLRSVARALGMPLTELIDQRENSVEQRLIRRFLERLPEHRLEDVVFRLMRDFGQEEAARRKRIALIGLRGAGKTTLGTALAGELGFPFIELDREIEREAGHHALRSVPALRSGRLPANRAPLLSSGSSRLTPKW